MFDFLKHENGEKGKNGKLILLILGGAVGILLLLFGGQSAAKEESTPQVGYEVEKDELVIYQTYLEKEIRTLCESVAGVKNVTVAVTLNGTFESVYATEWQEGREEYVILGSGASAEALYLTRYAPDIAGIGIVCTGGSSARVRNELIPLISTTFSVASNRIYITEGRK